MNDLHTLYTKNPKKHDELSAFHWFTKAIGLEYSGLVPTESPDFIINLGVKTIGIEITLAERKSPSNKYSSHEIEAAQREISKILLGCINPKLPLDVGLVFEDGVVVDMKNSRESITALALRINEISEKMAPHSVELLVRSETDMSSSKHRKHIFPNIPEFVQHVQLFNDGHNESVVTGAREGGLDYFTEADLATILKKKHRSFTGYQECDEHWLVVVAGLVPPLFVEHEIQPNLSLSSMATSFAGIDFTPPIKSCFEKVYFFNSPNDAILLT